MTRDKFSIYDHTQIVVEISSELSRSAQLEPLPSLGMAENKKYSYIIEYMPFFDLG